MLDWSGHLELTNSGFEIIFELIFLLIFSKVIF